MIKPSFDPGLTNQYAGRVTRVIGKDGSLNVQRRGRNWHDYHIYLHLMNMSWPRFFGTVAGAYFLVNMLFAIVYHLLGPGQLQGGNERSGFDQFMTAFFFSAHTLTTVGYGSIAPKTLAANIVAVIESMAVSSVLRSRPDCYSGASRGHLQKSHSAKIWSWHRMAKARACSFA